jgi:hypothetical protein
MMLLYMPYIGNLRTEVQAARLDHLSGGLALKQLAF